MDHPPDHESKPLLFSIPVGCDPVLSVLVGFLSRIPLDSQNLEIEAKFGRLVDKHSGSRIYLPICTEAVVSSNNIRFESQISSEMHAKFKAVFDAMAAQGRLEWEHQLFLDKFYSKPSSRTTFLLDNEMLQPVSSVKKERIGNLDIYFPTCPLDVRISINLEHPAVMPTSKPTHIRKKDRHSYGFAQTYRIDHSLVTSEPTLQTHELELEVIDPKRLVSRKNVEWLMLNVQQICITSRFNKPI